MNENLLGVMVRHLIKNTNIRNQKSLLNSIEILDQWFSLYEDKNLPPDLDYHLLFLMTFYLLKT